MCSRRVSGDLQRRQHDSYLKVAIKAVPRSASRHIRAVLKLRQISSHVLVAPRLIASEFGDVVPFVVGRPGEVHSVDLGAATKGGAPRIENTRPGSDERVSDIWNRSLKYQIYLRLCIFRRIQAYVVGAVAPKICVLWIAPSLGLIHEVFDEEAPRVRRGLSGNRVPAS